MKKYMLKKIIRYNNKRTQETLIFLSDKERDDYIRECWKNGKKHINFKKYEIGDDGEFARRIIEYRINNNLTQSEFAKICKISTATISHIENNAFNTRKSILERVERIISKDR